jgi:hypothetical protein
MRGKDQLQKLAVLGSPKDEGILTVYVNVDQSDAANLNRGFEARLKSALQQARREVEAGQIEAFERAVNMATEILAALAPQGRSLVLFISANGELLWQTVLYVPLDTQVHWRATPYVKPLVAAADEFERYAVILTDRQHARLFTVHMNEAREYMPEQTNEYVDRPDAVPRDHILSSDMLHDQANAHADRHLNQVVERLEEMVQSQSFDRLVLGGTREAADIVRDKLSQQARERLVDYLAIPVDSAPEHIHDATREFMREHERASEARLVDRILDTNGGDARVTIDVDAILRASQEGRIETVVYPRNHTGSCHACTR